MGFSLKCLLKLYYFRIVILCSTLFVLFFAMVIDILEAPLIRETIDNTYNVDGITDSVYLVIITLTTVGYGEIVPHSAPSKFIVMMICLNGAIVLSLFVVAINNNRDMNYEQLLVFHQINQAQTASNCIKHAMRLYVTKRKLYTLRIQKKESLVHMK